jgi:DHA1 family multidrug resistance protein-like MFS transporter
MKLRFANLELWERNLYLLFAATLLSVIGFSFIFPFLPLYVEELGTRTGGSIEFWSGMVFSAQALTMGIMSPVWGALSDRMGRKVMIERALFGGAIVLTLMGFARSAEELTLLRAIQGVITGVIPAASALIAASAPRERAGWALGLLQTSLWLGAAVGPLLGGVLADAFGFHTTFKMTGVLLVLSGISVHLWVVEQGDVKKEAASRPRRSMLQTWKATLTSGEMGQLYTIKFMVQLAGTIMLPIAPLLVASLMPGSSRVATVAGLFTAISAGASTLSAVRFGSLGDRIGHRTVLIAGCVLSALAYLCFLWVTNIWQLIGLSAIAGIANGAVIPSISALLANGSPEGDQGTVYGLDSSVQAAARMIAPMVGSAVAVYFALQVSFAVAGLIFLLAGAATFLMLSPQRPPVDGRAMAAD